MRNILILSLLLLSVCTFGQQRIRQITDQVEGVTVLQTGSASPIVVSGNSPAALSFDVLCTEVDGTSEGTLVLQGRNSSNATWQTLTSTDFGNQISFGTNDTLTIADAAAWKISIPNATFYEYQFLSSGGSGDTTQLDIWWSVRYPGN